MFGVYTVPYNSKECPLQNPWRFAVDDMVKEDGIDLSTYDHVMYLWESGACMKVASAIIGGKTSYYYLQFKSNKPVFSEKVIAHELGHNFGLRHANSYMCKSGRLCFTDQVYISEDCEEKEYQDWYDVMGSGGTFGLSYNVPFHTNSYFKSELEWLEPERLKTVSENGVYTIEPLEIKTSGIQSLIIPILFQGIDTFYFIEFRQPIGFDF